MSSVVRLYPDAKSDDSYQEGIEYQDFVCPYLAKNNGLIIQCYASKKMQYEKGESIQGIEIKLDNLCTKTQRLSIEVAEKTKESNFQWVPGGVNKHDNAWLYLQGNYEILFIFLKKDLRSYYHKNKPEITEKRGTIKTFYIPFDEAIHIAAKVIHIKGGTKPAPYE